MNEETRNINKGVHDHCNERIKSLEEKLKQVEEERDELLNKLKTSRDTLSESGLSLDGGKLRIIIDDAIDEMCTTLKEVDELVGKSAKQ